MKNFARKFRLRNESGCLTVYGGECALIDLVVIGDSQALCSTTLQNPPDLDVTASLGKLLKAEFTEDGAHAVRHPMDLKIRTRGGYTEFTLLELLDYELVVLNDF